MTGIIVTNAQPLDQHRLRDFKVETVEDEIDLINQVVDTVVDLDPDIIVGWEIQRSSWGYLSTRGYTYGRSFSDKIHVLTFHSRN